MIYCKFKHCQNSCMKIGFSGTASNALYIYTQCFHCSLKISGVIVIVIFQNLFVFQDLSYESEESSKQRSCFESTELYLQGHTCHVCVAAAEK